MAQLPRSTDTRIVTSTAMCSRLALVFCVNKIRGLAEEIIALDAQTLQLRYRFGLGLLNDARKLEIIRDELYVCDTGSHRLHVFSLTGEHRRSF